MKRVFLITIFAFFILGIFSFSAQELPSILSSTNTTYNSNQADAVAAKAAEEGEGICNQEAQPIQQPQAQQTQGRQTQVIHPQTQQISQPIQQNN